MTTAFEVPVTAPIKDASCFFLFPPGALRTALKNAFSKQVKDANDGTLSSLIKIVIQHVPEFHVPFAPLLPELSEYFSFDIFTDFHRCFNFPYLFGSVFDPTDCVPSQLQSAMLSLLPTIPKTVADSEFLYLLVPRLYCAQPGEEAMVMECVNEMVWEMLPNNKKFYGLRDLNKEGVSKKVPSKEENFVSMVQVIVRNNPMVLLSNLESLKLSHIEPIVPMILQPFLEGVEGKLLCGDVHVKQCLSKVDIDLILNLINLGKSDWRYRHYKQLFSLSASGPEASSYNVPFDSAANAVSNHGAIIQTAFLVDVDALLPPFPASLSTSFRQVTNSASVLNPVKFLSCLTRTLPDYVYDSIVDHFMAGKGPLFSRNERNLVRRMLSVERVGVKKSKTPEDFPTLHPEKKMTFKQIY